MPKKKPVDPRKEAVHAFARQLLNQFQPKDTIDVQNIVKDLMGGFIDEILKAELDQKLGYSKYDYRNKDTNNSRNGYSKKTVTSSQGPVELSIPRDREGEYAPQLVKKGQTDISSIEDKILSMYTRGMTNRDIAAHLQEIYGIDVSPAFISQMTDRILPIAKEWQNRPLQQKYLVVYMDATFYKVRQDGHIKSKAVYVGIGIGLDGQKEVLGMWIGQSEGARYWAGILSELRSRGVDDILIMCVDGLHGMTEAIHAVYPQADVQRCIVHQLRSTLNAMSYKDGKAIMPDLRAIYQAPSEEAALYALEQLEAKWGKSHSKVVASWKMNWPELSTYLKYPPEIRKMIYTTNAIENFNRQLRRVGKHHVVFPTDDALLKTLYLAMMEITWKWGRRPPNWNWGQMLEQFMVYFEGRITMEDINVNL